MKPLVVNLVGARPNFMKIGPIVRAMAADGRLACRLVHTGQHYDREMSALFFEELGIPEPDAHLEVGSGSHAVQTAEVMKRLEPILLETPPAALLVVGDVNSTMAGTLVAAKLGVPVAHVEAGLRSFDRTMPEEINRIVTDSLSRWLFTSEPSGAENLLREGVPPERIHFVGNVMIDSLAAFRDRAARSDVRERLGLQGEHAVVTLHRPSNVDDAATLRGILSALVELQRSLAVVFPVHPRTRRVLEAALPEFGPAPRLRLTEPLGYLDFLNLLSTARIVLTDSGGIQEETTVLNVPCLTLRRNTERPVTLTQGTNVLTGPDPETVLREARRVLASPRPSGRAPEKWDGRAAERIVEILARELAA